ncbi:roadblock/LC7 domain-containing protein [Rubrobacter indicoceani]|uniref:roadblock/LC7 domain-containing protein n=1 Tax=Rubrobacter indicoceani TaxID=2051957 RepID=UPI0013C48728|nr:roadblock/LC7 domain-containing protein [Rubrobacter indicoceani]
MSESGGGQGGRSLEDVLSGLRALSGDIESLAVLSPGGEVLYSSQPAGVERQRSSAMLSALGGLAVRAARENGKDHTEQVRVKTEAGHLLMVRSNDGGMIAATTGPDARVGLALYDMRNARDEVSRAVDLDAAKGGGV